MIDVGMIGLGEIGTALAQDLALKGFPVAGYDLDSSKNPAGVRLETSPAGIAKRANVILIAVTGSDAVNDIVDRLLPDLDRRHQVIDVGTTLPSVDIRCARICAERGASFVDAPITLRIGRTFLVGGVLTANGREVLDAAGQVIEVGAPGSGQLLKLANQLLVFGQVALQCEAVELARRVGLEPRLLSDELQWRIPERVFGKDFSGPDQVSLCRKDLQYVLELAEASEAKVPIARFLKEVLDSVGPGTLEAIVNYWRDEAGGWATRGPWDSADAEHGLP